MHCLVTYQSILRWRIRANGGKIQYKSYVGNFKSYINRRAIEDSEKLRWRVVNAEKRSRYSEGLAADAM